MVVKKNPGQAVWPGVKMFWMVSFPADVYSAAASHSSMDGQEQIRLRSP